MSSIFSIADGGDHKKFDDAIMGLRAKGIQAWPSPAVMEKMDDMDALCKIAHLDIGIGDTLAYYDVDMFLRDGLTITYPTAR